MTEGSAALVAQEQESAQALVGVDVGGTHTDVEVVLGDRAVRGKALTTYDDFSRGVLEALAVAAQELDLTLQELLASTRLIINGTTVVTNAITQMRGARVGVLVTSGFRDTFRIAGGPRLPVFDDHLQTNVDDLVPRRAIAEIDGRVNYAGDEIVALAEDQVREEVRRLVEDEGADALAICFLTSHLNPAHELRAEEIAKELYPDIFMSLSHRVHRLQGETRRWTTAVLNSFVHGHASIYLDTLARKLDDAGLAGSIAFFQGLGGAISKDRAERMPLSLLGSGPAGGAIGANDLARRMGERHVLIGDMGGTSFDVGTIRDNEIHIDKNTNVGRLATGVNLVDVRSIGAGGGSLVWVSERGVPKVGPASAGSTPGPACYGRGGEEPAVTDAMVVLGLIDPSNYLGGRVQLHPDLARAALDRVLASRFDWTTEHAAAAVYDLVVTSMANAMHEVSVQKGYDPRDFLFLAYGGTLPLFAWQIAAAVGISDVVIPRGSSVFCASGVLASDYVLRLDQTVSWNLEDADDLERVNQEADRMIAAARSEMEGEGFPADQVRIARSADLKFMGQVYELSLPLPDRPLVPEDGPQLAADFRELYERVYGRGTAWKGVPTMLLTYTVTATGDLPHPSRAAAPEAPADPATITKSTRTVFLPAVREEATIPIYDGTRFTTGTAISGPAIIDETDTTIYVPPGVRARRDAFSNYRLGPDGAA